MKLLKTFGLLVLIIGVASAHNHGKQSKSDASESSSLKPSNWLSMRELESLPSAEDITFEQLENMSVKEGERLLENICKYVATLSAMRSSKTIISQIICPKLVTLCVQATCPAPAMCPWSSWNQTDRAWSATSTNWSRKPRKSPTSAARRSPSLLPACQSPTPPSPRPTGSWWKPTCNATMDKSGRWIPPPGLMTLMSVGQPPLARRTTASRGSTPSGTGAISS